MINQSRSYRIFKGTIDFIDRDTNMVFSTETVFDLGDVGSFELYPYDYLKSKGQHVILYFTNNKPSVVLRYPYKDFSVLYERFLLDMQALDNRSQKKTLNYRGDMRAINSCGNQYFVTTFYPKNFIFKNKTEADVMDAILLNEIRPLS